MNLGELKRAGVRLTAEGAAQYKADLKSATAALAQMAAESKRNIAALGQGASASKRFGSAIKDLGNTAKLAQAKLDVLRDRQKQLSNASRVYASEIAKVENKMQNTTGSTKKLESALANLRSKESLNNAELSRLNTTIAKTETQMINAKNAANQMAEAYRNAGGRFADSAEKLKTMGGRFDQMGDKAMNFGRTMTTHVTTPIVAGLGYAAHAYMKFDDQMNQMRVQLDDGSVSAGKLKMQVEQLGKSSQNMAKEYGVAGESIRNGMNELIKKGFTFNQVTGAMPSILKATVASGDDFNSVMEVSASTLEQFGLKVNDTNQMLKNTERVTSVLTFTANKTSAGFADLGEAMQNVGPMAANNNQSLEDMAATLGVLSNRGIQGGEAGTYLMNALMNLATPTKQQAQALDELGVKTFDASGKMRAFPDILEDIENATKGMSDEQKNAALSTIFNTQAMKGINPLIQAGSKSIKELSASTKDASKYQDELAKKMSESASRNVAKMKESFKVLAETLGAQVVPAIIPLINKATDLANKFGNLDSKTQGLIVKGAALIAAIGPLAMTFGGISKGIGGALNGIGFLVQGFGRLTTSTGKVVEGAAKAGTGVSKFGTIASKVGGLAPMLSNPYVLAFGAIALGAAGLGMKIYHELHADDNAHQTAVEATKGKYQDWFNTVMKGATDAEGANTKLQSSVRKTGETTEQMSQRLKRQNTETMNSINDSINGHTKVLNKATTDARGFYRMQTEEIEGLQSKLKKLPSTTKAEVKQMTDAFKGMAVSIKGSYKDVMDASVKNKEITAQSALATINVTKDATSQIVNALNQKRDAELNDVKQMRENNLISQREFEQQTQSITQGYQKRTQALQDSQNKITQVMSAAAREHRKLTADETVEITKAYLKMAEESGQAITKNGDAMKLLSQNMQQLISEEGVAALKHAGILSKTQAETVKNAKSSADAIKIVKKAIEDYDKKQVKEKKLKAKDEASKEAKKASDSLDKHNKKKVEDKKLKAKDETSDKTKKAGKSIDDLNAKKAKEKELKAKDKVTQEAKKAEKALKEVDALKVKIKELKAKDEASEKMMKAKLKAQELNNQKVNEKLLKAKDQISALTEKVKNALKQVDALKVQVKELKAKDSASAKAQTAKNKLNEFNSTKMSTKTLSANGNASPFTDTAQGKINRYNGTGIGLKTLNANGNTSPFTDTAQGKINTYNGTNIPTKSLQANGNASPFAREAKGSVDNYNGTNIPTKNINVESNAPEQAQSAIGWLNSIPSVVTSYINVIKRFFGGGEHAAGGHIGAFASGGEIESHTVPGTYTGIVGEAGPEIFSVDRGKVTITPLSSREKMKGIEGVLEEYGGKKGRGDVIVNINFDNTVIKEEADENRLIEKMDRHLRRSLSEQQMIGGA